MARSINALKPYLLFIESFIYISTLLHYFLFYGFECLIQILDNVINVLCSD